MVLKVNPLAGKKAPSSLLINVRELCNSYYNNKPDLSNRKQLVIFGTSGHRGTSINSTFTESHIKAVTQAIVNYRYKAKINGPLFLGMDTHALSKLAFRTALEVLAANGVHVIIDSEEYTPTPVISHAILKYNEGKNTYLADGIIITPSHNPPQDGGVKYNPPHGGPAEEKVTKWIEKRANELLMDNNFFVKTMPFERAIKSGTTHKMDLKTSYIKDLASVLDFIAIESSGLKIGVDPLGGAAVNYWSQIAEEYKLNLDVVNNSIDPTFSFMTVDHDGKIRMDCSSPYAMANLISLRDKFDIAFGNDPDVDRHGIVTKSMGLMNPNHYLSVATWYLFKARAKWSKNLSIGKTVVSSSMIDRVAEDLGRNVYEVPVGFKWFVKGLYKRNLGIGLEESAGASFLRKDGTVWTTEKDGIILGLLSAEIFAVTGRDPGQIYKELTEYLGNPAFTRIDTDITPEQQLAYKDLTPDKVQATELAGDEIIKILTNSPGNKKPIGGIKVVTENSWFAARPSGTEPKAKLYAESFKGEEHLQQVVEEAQKILENALNR